MKNNSFLLLIVVLIILVGGFVFLNADSSTTNVGERNPEIIDGELQKVTISMRDYNYYPQTIRVKANQPVEVTLDDSVRGCLRAFTIRDFGVNQISRSPEEKIVFVPDRKGTFNFACSMGMGYGKIIVE